MSGKAMLALVLLTAAHAVMEPASGQERGGATVHGQVVEAVSGRPLPGASVRVIGMARQDVTHESGEFHLVGLAPGAHTVLIEHLGYRRAVREIELTQGETAELRVELHASAIALPGIVVTGTTRESLGDRTVRPAHVVSGQELARRMDATLAGTLQHEPGLAATSVGPATARPVIRGLGGDRVLVLEDGARVGDLSSASSDHALAAEPLNAQRIEVVRGPTALLYGSNALGGVINLIRDEVPTVRPERAMGVATLQGQSVNRGTAAGGSAQTGLGAFTVRGEGSYRRAGDLRTPHGTLENTQLETFSLAAGASRILDRGHYGAAYRFYDNTYGVPGGFVGSHPEGVDIEMRRHAVSTQARLHEGFGPFEDLELNGRYTNYYHRELEAEDVVGTEYGLLTASGELTARHDAWGPFESGAVGTRVGWRDYAAGGSTQTPPSREWSTAVYLLEELALGRVRLQGGGRFDWHRIEPLDTTTTLDIGDVRTRTFGSFSASLGAVYELAGGVNAGASIARAYRTPDTDELFSQGPHLAAYSYEVGNPELAAEIGRGADVFLRARRDRYSAEAAVFRNALDNYIYYRDTGERSPTGLPVYQATAADALLEGFELSAGAEVVRHVVVDGMLSYTRGTLVEEAEPLPMIPPLRGQLAVRYERPRYFAGVTWRAAAAQRRIAEFETETPGHQVIDIDAGLRWVALRWLHSLTLRLENVTDELVFDHLSRIRDADDAPVPGPGFGGSMVYRVTF